MHTFLYTTTCCTRLLQNFNDKELSLILLFMLILDQYFGLLTGFYTVFSSDYAISIQYALAVI